MIVPTSGSGNGLNICWFVGEMDDTEVNAEATLNAGDVERGLEFDVDVEREGVGYQLKSE